MISLIPFLNRKYSIHFSVKQILQIISVIGPVWPSMGSELNFRLRFLKFRSRLEMPRLFGSRFRFSVMKNWTFSPIFPLLLHQFSSVFNISKIFQDLGSFD